ncbi:MAG: T9SS C-terminal target domain-containing protein [Saprospirales bacterium]|nr:MAG: T9SS C-terminal target domain-containing protein [Saprospirales bacterium]
MKPIIIVLATLFTFHLQAADVTVTTEDAYPPGYTGSILVEIDQLLGNAPFEITVTKPGTSYSHTVNVSQYSWQLGGLSPGQYCIHITSNDGCVAYLCVFIKKCHEWFGTTHCLYEFPHVSNDRVLVAGIPDPNDGGGLGPNSDELDFWYYWYTEIDPFFNTSLSSDLKDSTYMLVNEILLYGSTPYDTAYQSEIDNPDAVFVISYDGENKEIQWVWHDLPPVEESRIIARDRDGADGGQIELYPNPTNQTLHANWPAGVYEYVSTFNMLGQEVLKTDLDLDSDSRTFEFDESYAPGVYIMKWHKVEGDYTSRRFILQR